LYLDKNLFTVRLNRDVNPKRDNGETYRGLPNFTIKPISDTCSRDIVPGIKIG
jgi:hypothetical protein